MKKFLVIFILSFCFMGCRKPDPTPELRDPIYQDISAKLSSAENSLKTAKKDLEEAQKALLDIKPQTREGKNAEIKYFTAEKKLRSAQQTKDFLSLHLINRKYAARNSYIRYYNLNKEDQWPEPSQFLRYTTQERLKNAPLEWNSFDIANQINEMK